VIVEDELVPPDYAGRGSQGDRRALGCGVGDQACPRPEIELVISTTSPPLCACMIGAGARVARKIAVALTAMVGSRLRA
jgi:hypothetical protein